MRPSTRNRLYLVALTAVLAIVGVVLVFLGRRQFLGYDSFIHIFVARQDRWPNFWGEVIANSHPPLFYALLRLAFTWFGRNVLAYRAVSIATTIASAALIAAVVRRTTSSRGLAIVAAAAYGLSYSALTLGLEVRSYALCATFTLAALMYYLDWLRTPPHRLSPRTFVGFAGATTAAALSHYSTLFFIAAAVATPLILAAIDLTWRRRLVAKVTARPVATAGMFGIPVAVAAGAYYLHAALFGGGRLNWVPEFMYDPTRETIVAFLRRNTVNLAGLLLPGGNEFVPGLSDRRQLLCLVILGLIAMAGLARLARVRTRPGVPLVVLVAVMTVLNAACGLAGRYPYGGTLRHEFFLVAFVIAAIFTLFDEARRVMTRRFTPVPVGIAALGAAASVALWAPAFHIVREPLFQAQMTRFHELIPSPQAVLLDQFSFIAFFMHHHDWDWTLDTQWANQPVRQVWRLRRGGEQLSICRDAEWTNDVSSLATYLSAEECLTKTGADRVALFDAQWELQQPTWDTAKAGQFADELSAAADLRRIAFESHGGNVYAEFARSAHPASCTGPPAPPTSLEVVSNSGRAVVLSWQGSPSAKASYVVEAGRRPGAADALQKDVGQTTVRVADVPPATYYVRVRGRNKCGTGDPSNEIAVAVR